MSQYNEILPPLKDLSLKGGNFIPLETIRISKSPFQCPTLAIKNLYNVDIKESNTPNVIIHQDKSLQKEAYKMLVEETITIYVNSDVALFYALSTLCQIQVGSEIRSYAKIYDAPLVKERSLHIDCGRKYFSYDELCLFIDDLARRKMNTLQLHFSENLGFRIESLSYPEIVSEKHLTQKEVLDLIEYAKMYHIQIIPSLDAPGHLKHILKVFPEFALKGTNLEALDISSLEARAFIKHLYDEFALLFTDSNYFNIGSDEFVDFETIDDFEDLTHYAKTVLNLKDGRAIDTYIDFINDIALHLESKGFIVRVWNDGLFRLNQKESIQLKPSIEICYWTKYNKYMAPLTSFEDKALNLINFHAENFYYILHVDVGVKLYNTADWFESWTPYHYSFNQKASNKDLTQGASYAIWCDDPDIVDVRRIYEDTHEPLWAMATKLWSSSKVHSYKEFTKHYNNYYKYL